MTDLERVGAALQLAKSACADMAYILNLHDQAEEDPVKEPGYHEWIMGRLLTVESDLNTAAISIRNLRSHCALPSPLNNF